MNFLHEYSGVFVKGAVAFAELLFLNLFIRILLDFYPYALTNVASHWSLDDRMRIFVIVANLSYLISLSWTGIVLGNRVVAIESVLNRAFKLIVILFLILFVSLYLIKLYISLTFLVVLTACLFVAFCIERILCRMVLRSYRAHGGNSRRIIILGAGSVANEVYNHLISNLTYGYLFQGFFDDRSPADYKVNPSLVKGSLAEVNDFVSKNEVEEIFCCLPAGDDRKALPIIKYAENSVVRCYIVPDFKRFIRKKVNLSFIEDIPIISMRPEPLLKFSNQLIKRLFDLLVSSCFMLTIFPILFIVLGLGIKISSPGPIFFRQKRTGENGNDFWCYKFRTMQVNKDADEVQATKNDSRVTKIGAFMRKTNLDEMPQFFNVLVGDMSLVGPRPHMLKHTEMYSQLIDQYMVRHLAKPGITGWAQVTGFRGETKTLEEMEGRVKHDVWYIENWSFWLDLRILFLTVYNMFRGDKNAY